MHFKHCSRALLLTGIVGVLQACQPYEKTQLNFGSADSKPETGTECLHGQTETGLLCSQEPTAPTNPVDPVDPAGPVVVGGETNPPVLPATFDASLTNLEVTNAQGAKPLKGDTLNLKVTLKNAGSKEGTVKVTPILTSKRFSDYSNIRLPSQDIKIGGGENKVTTIAVAPFISDSVNKKEYALNRGSYSLSFDFEPAGGTKQTLSNVVGKDFDIGQSNVVFTAVFWEQAYFDKQKYTAGIAQYLKETWSRKGEILTPTQKDGTSGNFTGFNNGFDEMMKVKTMFKTFQGFTLDTKADFSAEGILHQVEAYGKKALGLQNNFQGRGCDAFTHVDNHGYDMSVGLSENGFGGLAWICGNSLAAGVFDGDPSVGRTQMVLIHETGHNYGAPHCDPIQGFVMCSGEKHDHYINGGSFVWHQNSIDDMKKQEEANISNSNFNLTTKSPSEPIAASCNGFN